MRPCPVPAPAQPQPEDDAAGDCHQLRLPLRSIDLASGFVYSNSWTWGILIRGGFGLGRVCLLGFFLMTMKRHFDVSYLLRTPSFSRKKVLSAY